MYSSWWAEIPVSLLFLFKFPTLEYWSTLVYASSIQSKQKYQLKGLYPQSVVNHDMDKIKESEFICFQVNTVSSVIKRTNVMIPNIALYTYNFHDIFKFDTVITRKLWNRIQY